MRRAAALLLFLFPWVLAAQQGAPWHEGMAGYHDATLELARFCRDKSLFSECRRLARAAQKAAPGPAAELVAACEGKPDNYVAASWGEYLDKAEALGATRAAAAEQAGQPPETVLALDPAHKGARERCGQLWLDGVGWLERAEHERLAPCVLKLEPAPQKPERDATWLAPWVLQGSHFTLVTDLPWARALKYAKLLQRFQGVFAATLGDVIPSRAGPHVVWCCKEAATFVKFSADLGFPLGETNAGLHVGALGAVLINAQRCDEVGKLNRAKDNLARTLYHECTHRLVESGLRPRGASPWELAMTSEHAWIVEAMAVVFEGLEISDKSHTLKGLEAQRTYTIQKFWKGEKGAVPELAPVLAQGHAGFATEQPISSAQKYALAGSVAWFCLFVKKDTLRKPLLALLVDYYRCDTGQADFKTRFGLELAALEKDWKAWVLK